jgi:hypothetical protein
MDNNYINCHVCGNLNDVSGAVYILNRNPDKDTAGAKCWKCKSIMTVVITERGLRQLEILIKEFYSDGGNMGADVPGTVTEKATGENLPGENEQINNPDEQGDLHRTHDPGTKESAEGSGQ